MGVAVPALDEAANTDQRTALKLHLSPLLAFTHPVFTHKPAGRQEKRISTVGMRWFTLNLIEWMCVIGQLMST